MKIYLVRTIFKIILEKEQQLKINLTAFKPPAYYRNQETDQESNKEDTVNNETPEKMFMKKI